MISIASQFTSQLLAQPETGMGWQLVEVRLGPDWVEHTVVVNAEAALEKKTGDPLLLLRTHLRTGARASARSSVSAGRSSRSEH